MSRDTEAKNERLYDKRTIDRTIKKGLLTRKDFDKHLKALDDVASKGVFGAPEGGVEDRDEADDAGSPE
jgi:hypothetical protein